MLTNIKLPTIELPNVNLSTIGTAISHLTVTSPSLIYHGLSSIYNRYKNNGYINTSLENKNVIIFVHGRNGHYSNFDPLINNILANPNVSVLNENELTENAFQLNEIVIRLNNKIYVLRYADLGATGYTTPEEDTETLKNELASYKDCSIILIGLSKGGPVIAGYAVLKGDKKVDKVMTISSPLLGTEIASLFPNSSPVNEGLSYRNEYCMKVCDGVEASDVKFYHIVPSWDHLIIPISSAYYSTTPKSHMYFYEGFAYSHVGITYSQEVANKICEWIAD
jgi:pimeloyl-ACP methyl ester carboxylesterase